MRTTIDVRLDIVHELPLGETPGSIARGIEQSVTGWELMGQRDPKLSVRATLIGNDTGAAILLAGMLRSHAGELDKLATPVDGDSEGIARHRRNMAYMAELAREHADSLDPKGV